MTEHRTDTQSPTPPQEIGWSSSRRFWISLIVLFHLLCVFVAPMAVVEPRPGLAVDAQRVLLPYSESLFLIHGYRFFAPEPGPSHIVQFELTRESGEKISGQFPDRDAIWPRLLYHRWFMLSESLYRLVSETIGNQELDQWQNEIENQISVLQEEDPVAAAELQNQLTQELGEHERVSGLRDRLVISIGKNLLRKHNGQAVKLKLVTRVIPPPQDIERGLKLENSRYLPPELSWNLGTVYANSDQLEMIEPQEAETGDGQGRGGEQQ